MNQSRNFTISIIVLTILVVGGVGGYIYWQKKHPQPTLSSQATEWKTYRDEEKGFEIQYPSYLKAQKESDVVMFVDVSVEKPQVKYARSLISIIPQDKPITFEELLQNAKKVSAVGTAETLTVNGIQVTHSVESAYDVSADVYTLSKGSDVYVIEFPDSEQYDQIPKIPNQDREKMINSFKFFK